ncbi:MAG: hypothetical protein IPH49_05045 [Ignavibacteria bacterium]|nr:hypothetical protein [Ignavibacteria bacterium]
MHNEWQNEVDNDPELMYAQRGARQITIPFDFTHDDGRYHLLRLQELGGGIDTIVGQDKELAVNFLPGEGKMFRVTVLDAETPAMGSGWLSHNTQRKMVVYPTLTTPIVNDVITPAHDICGAPEGLENETFVRAQEAGGYRYHMVFHRRVSEDPNQLVNPLTVYYRRSELLTNDATNAADVDENGIYNPLIDWEDPIALTLIDRNGVAVEPVPSYGYPSIVVRNDVVFNGALMNPAVYVVYSCQGNIPNEILIVEAQLAANLFTHAAQVNSYENERSNVIATASSNPQCPGEQNDQLRYWGTPVINASLRGNYYAWSDYTDGIHVGFKTALVRDFVPGSIDILKYHVGSAMKAQYPSVPSYSKLAIGEDDCPIVWQEGPTGSGIAPACIEGRSIHYTRLFHLGNDVEHRLAARGVYQAGLNPFARNGDLLKISQTQNENANSFNRKPTIYRHLSEYDDALTDESSPFYINGYVNHKAERIAWEFKMIPPPGGQGGLTANRWQLRRTAIDVWDECTEDERSSYWHSGYSQIFAPGYDLVNPELIQGEQKTVLGAVINSEDIAQSWAFGDSSLVLSFNSEDGPSFPAAYHMTFAGGYHLDGNVNITESNGLGWAALDVSMNSLTGGVQGARAPHVAARHNIVRSQSLQKNRRITEAVPSFAQIGNYLPTPLIDRSTRGSISQRMGLKLQMIESGTVSAPMILKR